MKRTTANSYGLDNLIFSNDFQISEIAIRCVARNSQWGGGCFGGLEAEPTALKIFAFFFKK